MSLTDILQIFATLLAAILLIYTVMDFFSLAHQFKLKREKNTHLINFLTLLLTGAFFFSLARLATFFGGYTALPLALDTLALLLMLLGFYQHLRKTAHAYR